MQRIDYSLGQDRRTFLKGAALYGGALVVGSQLAPTFGQSATPANAAPAASNAKWRNQVGLELFTIGSLMRTPEEYEGALAKISEMGYREIEPAGGYSNLDPKEFRTMLDKYKISMPSTHSGASGTGLALEKQLEGYQTMGIKYTGIGGGGGGGARGGGPQIAGLTADQQTAVTDLSAGPAELTQAANNARAALTTAVFTSPQDKAGIQAKLEAVSKSEQALAAWRAETFSKLQASANRLNAEQLASLRAQAAPQPAAARGGGAGGGGGGNSVENVKRQAEGHNRNGAIAKKFGMKILIHNHTTEFALLDDGKTTQHDAMASNIDPEFVTMQLDIGWASAAGQDIISLFKKHPGRYELWHVKDMAGVKGIPPTTDGGRPAGMRIVPVGEGDVDYKTIFSYAALAGMKHYCIEQDGASNGGMGFQNVQKSIEFLLAKVLI